MKIARIPYQQIRNCGHLNIPRHLAFGVYDVPQFAYQTVSLQDLVTYAEVGTVLTEPATSVLLYSTDPNLDRLAMKEGTTRKTYSAELGDIIFLFEEKKAYFWDDLISKQHCGSQDCLVMKRIELIDPLFFVSYLALPQFVDQVGFLDEKFSVLEKKERLLDLQCYIPSIQGQQYFSQRIQEAYTKADILFQEATATIDEEQKNLSTILLETQLHLGMHE